MKRKTAYLIGALLSSLVLMGAWGGSFKARVDAYNMQYNNSDYGGVTSVSATWPVTVTDADIALEPFDVLSNSSAFSLMVAITNGSSASASLKLQFWDPVNGEWEEKIAASTGSDDVHTILTFNNVAPDGVVPITSLPVCRRMRIVAVHDATDDEYSITKCILMHQ